MLSWCKWRAPEGQHSGLETVHFGRADFPLYGSTAMALHDSGAASMDPFRSSDLQVGNFAYENWWDMMGRHIKTYQDNTPQNGFPWQGSMWASASMRYSSLPGVSPTFLPWETQASRRQEIHRNPNKSWLVVGPPLWKIWKSIGTIIPNIWENKIDGNQTTNQKEHRKHFNCRIFLAFWPSNHPVSPSLFWYVTCTCNKDRGTIGQLGYRVLRQNHFCNQLPKNHFFPRNLGYFSTQIARNISKLCITTASVKG